jgi:hypothetical protein
LGTAFSLFSTCAEAIEGNGWKPYSTAFNRQPCRKDWTLGQGEFPSDLYVLFSVKKVDMLAGINLRLGGAGLESTLWN